jgi:hypothetical protein
MLTIHQRSVNSTELLKVGVQQARAKTQIDITTLPVKMAVVEEGFRPETADYADASWETIDGVTYASTLVGPGGIQLDLTDEAYIVWVKVIVGPENIELKCFEDVVEVY